MKYRVTSVSNPKIKEVLKIKSDRVSEYFLVEGEILVKLALDLNKVITLFSIKEVEGEYPFDIYQISENVAKKLSNTKTSDGVFALIKKEERPLDLSKPLIYLDDVRDPGNVGTIMRSALAFDFGGVIASPTSVNFYNEKVIRSAKGAHFTFPLKVMSEEELIKFSKDNAYILTISRLKNAYKTTNMTFSNKNLLVVGNEAHGVSSLLNDAADVAVYIPIKNIESLNVAIAASILMEKIANNPHHNT